MSNQMSDRLRGRAAAAVAVPAALALALAFATGCDFGGGDGGKSGAVSPATDASTSAAPASNGIEKQTAKTIFNRARRATLSAGFLRIHGGFRDGAETITMDFRYAGRRSASGYFTTNGRRVNLIRVGPAVYVQGDDRFLKQIAGKGAVQLLSGKYLKATPKEPGFAEIAMFADLPKFINGVMNPGPGRQGSVRKGPAAPFQGRPAITLLNPERDRMYVATTGVPYLLRLQGASASDHLDFTEQNKPVKITPPPAAQVVDLSSLN